jgi:hypothetical protein
MMVLAKDELRDKAIQTVAAIVLFATQIVMHHMMCLNVIG